MMQEPILIPTDIVHFRNWLKAYLSHTNTAAYGLSDEFDEDKLDGYTYFGLRAITNEKRPPRGHPVTIRLLDSGDHSVVEPFSMSGDYAKFRDNLDQAVRDNWQHKTPDTPKKKAAKEKRGPNDDTVIALEKLRAYRLEQFKQTGKIPPKSQACHSIEPTITEKTFQEHAPELYKRWKDTEYW
jgi:hypothetical protein